MFVFLYMDFYFLFFTLYLDWDEFVVAFSLQLMVTFNHSASVVQDDNDFYTVESGKIAHKSIYLDKIPKIIRFAESWDYDRIFMLSATIPGLNA